MNDLIALIKHLYIYPVKSMRGVAVPEAFVGLNGIYGDRRYAFVQAACAASDGFPWMTGREKPRLILYSPQFEHMPTFDDPDPPIVVRTPEGDAFAVGDPRLRERIAAEYGGDVFLIKNNRGNYDSQHLSLFSLATLNMLALESDCAIDHRQFRANLYLEPSDGMPFSENDWVGQVLQIGEARVAVTQKDTRCMMINLDPESAAQNPRVLRTVARHHDEQAGVYANVIAPGVIRVGDPIRVVARAGNVRMSDAD